jgi:hypothetical protein
MKLSLFSNFETNFSHDLLYIITISSIYWSIVFNNSIFVEIFILNSLKKMILIYFQSNILKFGFKTL